MFVFWGSLQKIAIIKRTLVSELGMWQIKRRLKEELSALASSGGGASRPGGGGDVLSEIERILGSTGLGVELKNLIYAINRQALVSPPAAPEGLSEEETYCADRIAYVEEAKLQWEKRIRRELDVMAAELGVPLHRYKGRDPPRPQHDNQAFRFVYDDNDFLDILSNISSASNAPTGVHVPRWGMIHVELSTRYVKHSVPGGAPQIVWRHHEPASRAYAQQMQECHYSFAWAC